MKRCFFIFMIFLFLTKSLLPIFPQYYGARSLALGYSSTAFNYDINSIFINPSLLATFVYPMTGYQYQNSYLAYGSFEEDLREVLECDLRNFEMLNETGKTNIFNRLQSMFNSKYGMYGFDGRIPGFATRNYGISFSSVKTAIINPVSSSIFDQNINEISNSDIASLSMNFVGLRYNKFSIGYALTISRAVTLGFSLHYLSGRIKGFHSSLIDTVFSPEFYVKDYVENTWELADEKFSKFVSDFSVLLDVSTFLKIGVMLKNFNNPRITASNIDLKINRRIIGGLAFRPDPQFGLYFDMDINKSDLFLSGEKIQPVSFGIEKGLFNNKLLIRAGFLSDLTEKQFFSKESDISYGFGLGFNLNKIMIDFALGIDSWGTIESLAISGFIVVK